MKTAAVSATKWAGRAGGSGAEYKEGAHATTKDQAAAAIAAKEIYKSQLQASFARGGYEKGLAKSGKAGWLKGVDEKGEANYTTGVTSEGARTAYSAESGRFDGARNAAANMPRGPKGSPTNIARVTAVANAQHAVKIA